MRYRDAAHVDVHALLARRPILGWWYAAAGWVLILVVLFAAEGRPWVVIACALIALGLWCAAWWQVVGRLWRTPLILTVLVCATLYRLGGGAG